MSLIAVLRLKISKILGNIFEEFSNESKVRKQKYKQTWKSRQWAAKRVREPITIKIAGPFCEKVC